MSKPFDIEERWPDLFEGLTSQQRWNIVQSWADQWHEGWEPNREDVKDSIELATGVIDREEYTRRGAVRAEQYRGTAGYRSQYSEG